MDKSATILEKEYLNALGRRLGILKTDISVILEDCRKPFEGEFYMTEKEVCDKLKIARSTLFAYRSEGLVPYIQLSGKVLYRESDIQRLLDDNYHSAINNFKIKP